MQDGQKQYQKKAPLDEGRFLLIDSLIKWQMPRSTTEIDHDACDGA
jgi:hypothetical protein